MNNLKYAPVVILPLNNLMVLEAYNKETDQFLSWLEDHEVLPLSLAWRDFKGVTYRLYAFDGCEDDSLEVEKGKSNLEMYTGNRSTCYIPNPLQETSDWQWLPSRSWRDIEPPCLLKSSLPRLVAVLDFHISKG